MKKLNLRIPKSFDRSTESQTENPRIRFILVTEGATEESYFRGIKNNKLTLQIKNNIQIEIMQKKDGEESYSHPYQLIQAALHAMGRIDDHGNDIPQNLWHENCIWDYDNDFDTVCVIFDRDYKHLENNLEKIYELCSKHNIFIGISNPNFELWLLMHFPDIAQYDKSLLYQNPKNIHHQYFPDASANKKYLEILVARSSNGYKKGHSLKFERFIDNISLAIEQEKLFEENPLALSNNVGSNIGCLITKIKNSAAD